MSPRVRLWPTAFASLLLAGSALGQASSPAALDAALASANKLSNGGFESALPAYWTPSGAGATWPVTVSRSATHSLALSGVGAASWTMGEAVRNWTDGFGGANVEVKVNAYAKADGVNTNPTTDASKFQLVFEFFSDAAQTTPLAGVPAIVLDLPQTAASTDWVKVDNSALGSIIFPAKATSARITFRKGASATGTMYLDDVYIEGGGTVHNGNVDAGDQWYYYTPAAGGGYPSGQQWVNGVTNADAHTGTKSLKIQHLTAPNDGDEAVHISQRVPVTPNKPVLISYWVKTEGNASPTTIGTRASGNASDNNIGLTALWYTNLTAGRAGYGEVGGADIRLNGEYNPMVIPLLPRQAANGWTQYSFVVTPPTRGATDAPIVGMELRLRYWHGFTGTTYWDDVVIADVADVVGLLPNTLANGSFEAAKPAYWDASGAGAIWATNEARSANYSLGLSGAGAASWTMGEAVRNWTDFIGLHGSNGFEAGEVVVSAYVKAVGVNTAPTTDAGKFQLVFEFFNQPNGTNVLGQPIVIDLPQTAASTNGWVKVDNLSLGAISLPQAARSVRITFRKGATATGAMYLDDLTISGAKWPGTIHNGNVDAGDQWYYFTPDAEGQYPNGQTFVNGVSAEAARSGARGLTIRRVGPANTTQGEAVQISQRVPATNGNPMLVSFWLRTTGVAADSVGRGDYNIGATGLWYTNMTGGAAGYGEVGGFDVRFNGEYNPVVIPNYKNDANGPWKQYAFVAYPPLRGATEAPVVGMELRLRYWHKFEGTAMFDDVSIVNLGGTALATGVDEENGPATDVATRGLGLTNFPNPFGQGTTVGFRLGETARVTLEVYNVLGQRVARVLDGTVLTPGTHAVPFEGNGLPSGTYVYVLRAGDRTETRTMTVLR